MGRRAGALQEELSRPRRDGPPDILRVGGHAAGAGRCADSWTLAVGAGKGFTRRGVYAHRAAFPRRLENHSRPHQRVRGARPAIGRYTSKIFLLIMLQEVWRTSTEMPYTLRPCRQ